MTTEVVVIVVLGAVALSAGAGCVWLALGRGRALAAQGAAEAEVRRAGEELGRAEARVAEERRGAEARAAALQTQVDERGAALTEKVEEIARLEEQLAKAQELFAARQRELEEREVELKKRVTEINVQFENTFKALAQNALVESRQQFLAMAEQGFKAHHTAASADIDARKRAVEELVKPIGETLKKTDERLGAIEKQREASFATLGEQLRASGQANELLRSETEKLTRALSRPEVRGRYGEIQLRRVAELAGMSKHCDFAEQTSVRDEEGRLRRPDMVVSLPNDRQIAVDAKCNIDPYVRAAAMSDDAARENEMERFAKGVEEQIKALSAKRYWSQYEGSPDFVVMFMPGDQFLDAALSRRSELLERSAEMGVLLASPASLIGLLRAVAVGWREHKLADDAQKLLELGRELHDRAANAWEAASKLGEALERTITCYNSFAGSVEKRLTPTLRKFEDAGVTSGKTVPSLTDVTVLPRLLDVARRGEV